MKTIISKKVPAAIGPYSHAVEINGLIYTSGVLPMDLQGNIVAGGITEQTNAVMTNIKNLLEDCGSSVSKIIKTTVFMSDLNNFADYNIAYGKYFDGNFPVRSTVEVKRLPKDVLIEIDVIAVKTNG